MVKIKAKDLNNEILQRVIGIEQTLAQGLKQLEEKIDLGQEVFQFFNDGLKACRERSLKKLNISINGISTMELSAKIKNDKELTFPHRKILDFLLGQLDFQTSQFKEVYYSKLVKECRIGTNMANAYLSLLEKKGYIEVRYDGYRKFFKICKKGSC